MTSLITFILVVAVVAIALRSFEWSLIETIFFAWMLGMAALSCCP